MQTWGIVEADLRKLRHDPSELLFRMTQPIIWLLIFGQSIASASIVDFGQASYLDYLAPGVLAQSILFIGIFYGIAIIWERDMGALHKILVTPVPRVLLVIGRAIAAGVRGLSQVVVLYILSLLLGIHVRLEFFPVLGVIALVVAGAALFSTFSLIVACIVKKRERFMGIGQVMTMPLFFASNALYPITSMPHWIRILSTVNPLTYMVDGLRSLMIVNEVSHFGLLIDFAVVLGVFALLAWIATILYPKILY